MKESELPQRYKYNYWKFMGFSTFPPPYPKTLIFEWTVPYIIFVWLPGGPPENHQHSEKKAAMVYSEFPWTEVLLCITISQKGALFYQHPYQIQEQRRAVGTCSSSDRPGCCNPVAILSRKQNVNTGMLLPRPPLSRLPINSVTPCKAQDLFTQHHS